MGMGEEVSTQALQQAVESLHNCKAEFDELVHVTEEFEEELVWDGEVHIFHLLGHPKTKKCYAWSSLDEDSNRRRFYAVLHISPVTSAVEAVRASIVNDYREGSE